MKRLPALIITIIVLSSSSYIHSQPKEDAIKVSNVERNPFLVGKRSGTVVLVNNNTRINPSEIVYDRNIFLAEKRHGAVIFVNRNSIVSPITNNLIADRNIFLTEKRHGAVINNYASEISKPLVEQNIFLRHKRHQ